MTRVLLAPDSFKGSADARTVAEALARGIATTAPGVDAVVLPVADGGEGTLDAALAAGWERVPATVTGPTGAPAAAAWARHGDTAVVELAAASGLGLLPGGVLAPLAAGSHGTGELLAAALDSGVRRVVLGVGGSACTDGGSGLLVALGARVRDAAGADVGPGGGGLAAAATVDLTGLDPRWRDVEVVLAADVDNPLTGPQGAAAVYGPQKGATPEQVAALDAALGGWGALVDPAAVDLPGAGAAGGVGFAALAVLGATRRPGIDVVLELVGFTTALRDADVVVTGEGSVDAQTLRGKAPAGVAAAARAAGVPVVVVCGRCEVGPAELAAAGVVAVHPLTDLEPDPARSQARVVELCEQVGASLGAGWARHPAAP